MSLRLPPQIAAPAEHSGQLLEGLRAGPATLAFLLLCGFVVSSTVSEARESRFRLELAQTGSSQDAPEIEGEADPEQSFAYQVSIAGELGEELATLLRETSQLEAQAERPPLTAAALATRVEADVARLRAALRSEGYYDSSVESEIDIDARPVQVTIEVAPGTRYSLDSYEILYQGAAPDAEAQRAAAEAAVPAGGPAEAEPLKQAERQIVRRLNNRGYPFAEIAGSKYVVDHATKSMRAEITVAAGPAARFGPLTIEGLEDVREDHARRVVDWQPGASYDARQLEQLRQSLSGTGLFDSVVIEEAESLGPDGSLPVTVTVIERPQRSFGGGIGYSTDQGFNVNVFWEHRNLFNRAENLRIGGELALNHQEATADFRKPYFLRRDQSLLLSAAVVRQKDEAFDELSSSVFGGVERTFGEHWTSSVGTSLELIRITEDGTRSDYGLVGFPISFGFDNRDDPLDPTKGFTLSATTTPYFGISGDAEKFWVNEIKGSTYLSIDSDGDFVLAARARLGSIVGSDRQELPASKRFYAGGGGSVRGYEFRTVGPLDDDNDPIGGRSVVEAGLELRLRVSEDIGVVPFISGGQVTTDPYPDIGGKMLWAAGLGVRYYTDFGPLRFDIAFPVNGRPSDDRFQFYVSIGQAF